MNPPASSILIVDDEEVTRMMIRRVLTGYGYQVREAVNGRDAVQAFSEQPADLVLMDVRMPEMNGFDACRALRDRPLAERVPVLMLTALDDVMAVTLAFEAGATDFVTKPINWTLLAQRVRYSLRTAAVERELRISQLALAQAQRMARLGPWRLDLVRGDIECSADFCDVVGLPMRARLNVREFRRSLMPEDRRAARRFVKQLRTDHRPPDIEIRLHRPEQGVRYLALSGAPERLHDGRVHAVGGVVQDVSARRSAEAKLSYQAHFDEVTGLPKRVLFRDRLSTALAAARIDGRQLAVFSIEVDTLHKAETLLTGAGTDQFLKIAARRVQGVARGRDTACRMDGNTFALLLDELPDERVAATVANRLTSVFAEPVAVDGRELLIGMAAGIAVYPGDGDDVDELLAHASAAKARVLQGPGSGYQFYTTDMQERVLERLTTEVALYRGLERGEFELHFQPMVDVARGRVVAVEALLRWNRPGHGLQAPDSFIPLLEQTGLVMDTGDWVLRSGCKAVRDLPLSLAVNMSPSQFRSPHMAEQVMRILEETGFPPDRLELEITEQIVMEDDVGAIETLRTLGALGIRVALDDYGTGFSSLQRLKKLPLHTLKIDKSFVTRLNADSDDLAIVRSTIDMCHQLGIVVVAEGVEDQPTLVKLQELGCDIAQGYGLCRPLTLEGLQQWMGSSPFSVG